MQRPQYGILILFALFLCAGSISAQGGSSIITLVLPPPGGDGYAGALQTGGSFAEGAASLYYNPAALGEIGRFTGTQLQTTYSHQQLLPTLDINDLYQNFWGISASLPDFHGVDVGIGFFRNETNFGETILISDSDQTEGTYDPHEDVYALGVGLRLGIPVSIGGTAKFYDSQLGPGVDSLGNFTGNAAAYGWAFDLGILVSPQLHAPAEANLPYMELTPSLGLVWQNLGPEAHYSHTQSSAPIPRQFNGSIGGDLQLFDLFNIKAGMEKDYSTYRGVPDTAHPVITYGYSLGILCYRFSQGLLKDPDGQRREVFYANAFELNLLQLHRFWKRLNTQDFKTPSENLIPNVPDWSHLHFTFGIREIHADDGGIRQGQTSYYAGISL